MKVILEVKKEGTYHLFGYVLREMRIWKKNKDRCAVCQNVTHLHIFLTFFIKNLSTSITLYCFCIISVQCDIEIAAFRFF